MAETRVAIRYATSLLKLAQERDTLEAVMEDMITVKQICDSSREFRLVLSNPIIGTGKKQEILNKVFSGKIGELPLKFVKLVTDKGREDLLYIIAEAFFNLYNDLKGIQPATVTVAVELDDQLRTNLADLVKKYTSCNEVKLEEKVDPDIIGGYILRIGDKQVDQSIRNRLKRIKSELLETSVA